MRLLLLCASYSPRSSSPAFRTTNIAKALEKIGNEVFVLTYSEDFQLRLDKRDRELEKKQVKSDNIYRIGQSVSKKSQNNKLLKDILYKYGVANFLFPDPHIKNFFKFYNKAKELIDDKKIDIVITYSFPHSFHVIGYFLKKKFPEIKWVLDYGDIWYGAPFEEFKKSRLKKKLDFLLEKKLLSKSDLISLTTKSSIEFYKKTFQIDKFCLTEMGHNKVKEKLSANFEENTIKIIHAGRLYYPMRDPLPLIKFLENQRNNYELVLVGDLDSYLTSEINKLNPHHTKIKGWMTVNELKKEFQNSHVLILFGNQSALQVPGKLYEYLSWRIPIIYLHHDIENDPVLEITEKYNFVYPISNLKVDEEFSKALIDIKDLVKNEKSSNYKDYFEWEKIGARFNNSLKDLMHE